MDTRFFSRALGELDDKYIKEAEEFRGRAGRPARKWLWLGAAACLAAALCALALPKLRGRAPDGGGETGSMLCVNDTLYRAQPGAADMAGREGELNLLGTVESAVDSARAPTENLQANADIVGSEVYELEGEIYLITDDGEWVRYRPVAPRSVEYTRRDDGTYLCMGRSFRYKLELRGMEGETEVTYTVLTDDPETTFEDVERSLTDPEGDLDGERFVILGWS